MYFIGLTFHQNFVQFKKLDSFRRQFDPQFHHCKMLQMTLLPPFELPKLQGLQSGKQIDQLCLQLEEDLESVFFGQENLMRLDFEKLEFSFNRKPMIYLRAQLPEEIIFAQQTLAQSLEDWEVTFKRQGKKFYETVLPIGRPKKEMILHQAISTARSDFSFPISLYVSSIVVFEKLPGHWPVVKRIYHCDIDPNEMRPNEFGISKDEKELWLNSNS